MEYILYILIALLRGIFFPDFNSLTSIIVIHFVGPFTFAAIALYFSPKQRFQPKWSYFNKSLVFLLVAEILGLGVYATSGGLPYLLGKDFTPALIVASIMIQVLVFVAAIIAGSKVKYAPAP